MSSYGPEDFGGSDYLSPEEEARYIAQQRKSRTESNMATETHSGYMTRLEQSVKNAEHRADFLQDLANSHEQGMIERQGKIEALEKEQDALLATVAELRSKNKKLQNQVSTLQHQKSPSKQVTDYRRVDSDLLVDFALAVLDNGVDYDGFTGEARELQEQIEEKATFHPHVQQEIVKDQQGILRFRQNKLVDQLTEIVGMNKIARIEASVEDRAQLAQLIGYSVSGYGDLSYSLPIEEDKLPTKQEGK
jgi:hypothetical protein